MPSIKDYNDKLKSLRNTQKITKTMKMVSASKLRKAQGAQVNAKLYAHSIKDLISRMSGTVEKNSSTLLKTVENPKTALILIINSDKGLCGAFNNNANKMVAAWIEKNRQHYDKIDLCCCGKKGYGFFKKRDNVIKHYEEVTINPKFEDAQSIGEDLSKAFSEGQYDEIYISYNEFISPLAQNTLFNKVLPIDPNTLVEKEAEEDQSNRVAVDYIFEPKKNYLLDYLIPHYLYFTIFFALLENSAGEHGARMSAMDSASKNATELIDKNTLLRNRARQAQITTELTEIVAGAEALN